MNGTSGFQQDAQKNRPARPQQAKRRCVLCSVRGASERSENDAGGLFQHPARSAAFYLPPSTNRLLHEQQLRFGTGFWRPLHTHDLIASSTDISAQKDTVPDTFPRSLMGRKRRLAWLLIIMMFHFFVSPVSGIAEDLIYFVSPSDQSGPYKASLPFDPIPIGCSLAYNSSGCRSTDHVDWHITLVGDLAESVTLQFDNIPFGTAQSIKLRGNIEPVKASSGVYRVMTGESDILRLASPVQSKTMKANTDDWPAGTIKEITFNQQKLEQLLFTPVRHNENTVLGTVQVVISQRIGKVTVGKRKLSLVFDWRWAEKTRCCNDPSDRVKLPFKLGTGNSDIAVIMIDGRRSQGWTNDEIFRDSGTATALVGNYLTDDNQCKESPNGPQCRSEVAVFEKHHALRLDTQVSVWTDPPVDVHTTSAWSASLIVPVKMWVLWEHADSTKPPSETTEDLARLWVQKANQLYDATRCGVQFEIISIENKVPEASTHYIPDGTGNRTWQKVTCDDPLGHDRTQGLEQLGVVVGYMPDAVNVYFTDSDLGTARGWTCFDQNVILIRTPQAKASDETLAHELGHTLSLEHTNTTSVDSYDYNGDLNPDFAGDNLMWGGGLMRNKVSLGQCFRCNVNSSSALYRNNIPNAVFSGQTPRDCFDPIDSFGCPWLGRSE